MFRSAILDDWLGEAVESLVAGDGAFGVAVATVFGTPIMSIQHLLSGPGSIDEGGCPRVFESLKRVLFVVPETMLSVDALICHKAIWHWVEKIASAGDQHELAFVFILPEAPPPSYEKSLAVGLAVSEIAPETTGHAVWRRSGSLEELLDLIKKTRPMDLVLLRRRCETDRRHAVLAKLRSASLHDDLSAGLEVARCVLSTFAGREYDLDLFCRPPSHRHGNLLRAWLDVAATSPATRDWWAAGQEHLAEWLADSHHPIRG